MWAAGRSSWNGTGRRAKGVGPRRAARDSYESKGFSGRHPRIKSLPLQNSWKAREFITPTIASRPSPRQSGRPNTSRKICCKRDGSMRPPTAGKPQSIGPGGPDQDTSEEARILGVPLRPSIPRAQRPIAGFSPDEGPPGSSPRGIAREGARRLRHTKGKGQDLYQSAGHRKNG